MIDLTDPDVMAAVERCVLWHLPADLGLHLGPIWLIEGPDDLGCNALAVYFEHPHDPERHIGVVWQGFAVLVVPDSRWRHDGRIGRWWHYGRVLAPSEITRFTGRG